MMMTFRETEKIVINHSHKAISDFRRQVDALGTDFNNKLQLREDAVVKVVEDLKADVKFTDEPLQKKIGDAPSKVLTEAVNSAKELTAAAVS